MSQDNQQNNSRAVALTAEQMNTPINVFGTIAGFQNGQRVAQALMHSTMVPKDYQGNMGNCLIALDMASRTGTPVTQIMQNTHIIEGRPSWSSQYVIASLNSCAKFGTIRFETEELGEKTVTWERSWFDKRAQERKTQKQDFKISDVRCRAWARDAEDGERINGPWVSIEMAVKEGWYGKNGSKWQTMPELMLQYRAAAFFGRLHAPEILLGMQTVEEVQDIIEEKELNPRQATTGDMRSGLSEAAKQAQADNDNQKEAASKKAPKDDIVDAEYEPVNDEQEPQQASDNDVDKESDEKPDEKKTTRGRRGRKPAAKKEEPEPVKEEPKAEPEPQTDEKEPEPEPEEHAEEEPTAEPETETQDEQTTAPKKPGSGAVPDGNWF